MSAPRIGHRAPTDSSVESMEGPSGRFDICPTRKFTAEIFSGPDGISSSFTTNRLESFIPEYGLDSDSPPRIPFPGEFAHMGRPSEISLYEEGFKSGLRLPLPQFFVDIFNFVSLAPGQIVPNSWSILVGVYFLLRARGLPTSTRVFFSLFTPKASKQKGWVYFAARPNCSFLRGLPDSIKGWKDHFLFFQAPEALRRRSWNVTVSRIAAPKDLTPEELQAKQFLLSFRESGPLDVRNPARLKDFQRLYFGDETMVRGISLVNLVDDLRDHMRVNAAGTRPEDLGGASPQDPVQVDSPRPLQIVEPAADLPEVAPQASSSQAPAEIGDPSSKKRKREEKKKEKEVRRKEKEERKEEKKKKEEERERREEERKEKELQEREGREREERTKKEEERRSEPPSSQPQVEAAEVVAGPCSGARTGEAAQDAGAAAAAAQSERERSGRRAGKRPTPALQLQAIEAQLLHRRNELLVEPVVEAATDSSINLYEYLKLSAQTQAHMAEGAHRRAVRLKEGMDRRYAELERKYKDLQSRLSEVEEEHRWESAVLQNRRLQAVSDLRNRTEAEATELRRRLEESEAGRASLTSERDLLKIELDHFRLLSEAHEQAIKSYEEQLQKGEVELKLLNASRDRLSRDLGAAHQKIDSLFSYEAAVKKFMEGEDFQWEVRSECNNTFAKVTKVYEATVKRLIPGVSLDQIMAVFREEAVAAEQRESENSGSLSPEAPQTDVAGTSRAAGADRTPSPPADPAQQQQHPSTPIQ